MNTSRLEPLDEDDWANEDEWQEVVALVREAFSEHAAALELGSDRFDPFVVDATVVDISQLPREAGLEAASKVRRFLEQHPSNWTLRLWVQSAQPQQDLYVWLEVDRFRVAEYLGKKFCEQFETLESFVAAMWGASQPTGKAEGEASQETPSK